MTRKMIACYVAYNSADVIEQSLNSIVDLVDFVVSVDGAYLGMPVSEDFSTDGTQDIVKRIAGKKCKIILPSKRLSEVQSRNLYMEFVLREFPDAWIFTIDSDEVLRSSRNDFAWLRTREARQYGIVHIKRDDKEIYRRFGKDLHTPMLERSQYHPRIYGGIDGLHYAENHWTPRDYAGDRVEPKYANAYLKEAWLEHRHNTRDPRKLDDTGYYDIYQRWRYEKTTRPVLSYLPYQLVRTTKRVLLRGNIDPNRLLSSVRVHLRESKARLNGVPTAYYLEGVRLKS